MVNIPKVRKVTLDFVFLVVGPYIVQALVNVSMAIYDEKDCR